MRDPTYQDCLDARVNARLAVWLYEDSTRRLDEARRQLYIGIGSKATYPHKPRPSSRVAWCGRSLDDMRKAPASWRRRLCRDCDKAERHERRVARGKPVPQHVSGPAQVRCE